MTDEQRSAAASIYPHLKSQERSTQQPTNNSIPDAMWPSLVKKPPPPPNLNRERLLRHLREANAAADARLRRERGR
jgi:hypothetical protein